MDPSVFAYFQRFRNIESGDAPTAAPGPVSESTPSAAPLATPSPGTPSPLEPAGPTPIQPALNTAELVAAMLEAFKASQPAAPAPIAAPSEPAGGSELAPAPEAAPVSLISAQQEQVLISIITKAAEVPAAVLPLVPSTLVEAQAFLESPAYLTLKEALTPAAPAPAPSQSPDTGAAQPKTDGKAKTKGPVDLSELDGLLLSELGL